MAGDWIKMRIDLRDDPEVFRLSSMLKIDRFSVVGRLHAFWSWWDEKSRNGRVDGAVTVAADEVAGLPGFGDAMLVVGWLGQDDKGLYIPNHERHNGRVAKERAQGKQRQEAYRARNGASNASITRPSRTRNAASVTREEKSISNKHPPVANSNARSRPAQNRTETPSVNPNPEPPASAPAAAPPGDGAPIPPEVRKAIERSAEKRKREPAFRTAPQEPGGEVEWWITPAGVQRTAREVGVAPREGEDLWQDLLPRTLAAMGPGPWLDSQPETVRARVEHFRAVGVNP